MAKIKLSKIDTKQIDNSQKEIIKEENEFLISEIVTLQRKMYAQAKYSLLIIVQGMDASGKHARGTHAASDTSTR